MRTRAQQSAARGFSLVELLVVIGIITLLISILLPALGAARERANQIKCMANLHAIQQAAEMHLLHHQNYLPAAGHHWDLIGNQLDPAGLGDPLARRYTYYMDNGIKRPAPITVAFALEMGLEIRTDSRAHLEEDLKRQDLIARFHCPSQFTPMHGLSQIGPGWISPLEYSSYIFNEALMGRREFRPDRSDPVQGNIVKVKHPSEVFLVADGNPRSNKDGEVIVIPNTTDHETLSSFVESTAWGAEAARGHMDYRRHGYRMNVVFADGHGQTIYMTDGSLQTVGVSEGIFN